MADQVPTSRKVPPLAIIVIVILAALAAVAFGNWRSTTRTPSGGTAPGKPPASDAVMPPAAAALPNGPAPASEERGAMGHKNSSDEPGGPATTANVVGSSR